MASSTLSLTYEDERAMREIAFKWSIAWDKKDLQTFLSIAASEFTPDYSDFAAVNTKPQACAPEQFFTGAFRREGLGHPDLKTQHLLGASTFSRTSASQAKATYQVRAWHVRKFADGNVKEWDSSSFVEFTFVKAEGGEWKLAGLRPHGILAAIGKHNDVVGME